MSDYVNNRDNMVLFPISASGYEAWAGRSEKVIRRELKLKTEIGYAARLDLEEDANKTITAGDQKV